MRPGFAAMLERIEGNGVRTIIVETARRATRRNQQHEQVAYASSSRRQAQTRAVFWLGRSPITLTLEKRILEAPATPGRPGVRVIARQFGVNPGTVQRIARPFEASVAAGLQ
jgi:hypothetical protein